MRRVLLILVACCAVTFGTLGGAPSAQATDTCSRGWVCIYKGDVFDGSSYHPMVWAKYNYGVYNFSNLVGEYTVRNCQYGGAKVALYSGYNAKGSILYNFGNNCATGLWTNLTPVNSAYLYA